MRGLSFLGAFSFLNTTHTPAAVQPVPRVVNERAYWVDMLTRIVQPVLEALSAGKLKLQMPVEAKEGQREGRLNVTYLEALGRSLAGLAPWLELGPDGSAEGRLREKFIRLSVEAIRQAVTPSSPDYMNFTQGGQPLVDAAFLCHALVRAPRQLWGNLDADTRRNLIEALHSTRAIKPHYSNWLLFTAMVEAALLKFTGTYDAVRIDYALREHEAWYKGDGVYGDGPAFHFDYYNSFVIQPMLLDILDVLQQERKEGQALQETVVRRAQRYGAIQERLVSPEGTFPVVGRSLAYRCGAFQLLAQLALQKRLPSSLAAGQVRSALGAVIRRSMDAPGTFDSKGWLTIGFCGHQPEVGEGYISTGSLYLCSVAFLPLGLPATDAFWTDAAQDWTSKRAYSGNGFSIDHALE